MGLFGIEFRAPTLPSWQEVRTGASNAVQGARDFGSAAVDRAQDLGTRGVDLGRRAIADPEGTVRAVAADVRQSIDSGVATAQGVIRDGVMASGRGVGIAAEFARQNVPGGDNLVSNAVRGGITRAENNSRFAVGFVGGVGNEALGLAGTVGTLATYGVELQVSPQARAELGTAIVGGVQTGGQAIADYGRAVVADPGRLVTDTQAGATAAWNAGSGFVGGQVQRHEAAFARGEGFETLGMTTGQVATYVVPIGGGPVRGAVTASVGTATRAATTTVVREGTEALVRRATGGVDEAARAAGGTLDGLADVARRTGTSEARLQEVVNLERGNRPAPTDYLSPQRIAEHRAAFDDGASRFTLEATVDKYGLGQRDGTTFVMTRAEADNVMRATAGDPRRLEEALGLPVGQLDNGSLVRVDFPPQSLDDLDLRMPTGNEAGANDQWLPGGLLPSGANEAVIDGAKAALGQYTINRVGR